ncbi:MAG: cobalt ECF transporter T component CbiQ [Lachnospiraceae bacterium]|nr:cobalt ECF transporter T component CbiQ [Lachnospiraceae bacterium]
MNKLRQAVKDIHIADDADSGQIKQGGVHPLSRVIITLLYILIVVSFSDRNLAGLAGMVLYLLINIIWNEISVLTMLKRIWPVLLLTGVIGIAAPVMNRDVFVVIEGIEITYGMLAMLTLMIKGMFCVVASYILTITVGIRQICYTLRIMHVPEEIVTVIMLMHRYLMVIIKEVERMQQAYRLRAPSQKGLQFKAWGSFVGLLLLRSMDRAGEVYESMKLRGFHGRIQHSPLKSNKGASILYVLIWGVFLFLLKLFPVFQIVGSFLAGR